MRRRGSRSIRKEGVYQEITSTTIFNVEKSVNLTTKFNFDTIRAIRFSRDYELAFLFTQSGSVPHYVLNVVDINNIDTWTLKETWGNGDYRGGHVNNNGTKVYGGLLSLIQFNLSTPYLMSSRTQVATLTVGGTGFIGGVTMNPDETKLFVQKYNSGSAIREFNLITPGDISGAVFVREVPFLPVNSVESSLTFINNGNGTLNGSNASEPPKFRTVSEPYTLNNLSASINLSGDNIFRIYGNEINQNQDLIYGIDSSTVLHQLKRN